MQATIQTAQPNRTRPVDATRPATPDAIDLLEEFGTTITVQRDHEIYAQGDNAAYCWKVLSGCVRTVKLMEDGRRQVGDFLLAGEHFGFDDLDTCEFAAEAVSDVTLRRYPRRLVESLADSNAALAHRLRDMTLTHLRNAYDRMVMLGRKTAMERVASFLLDLDHRATVPGRTQLELPMSRTDVADHLGLTVETVCRLLAHMKREGTIDVLRSGVALRDRLSLRALASDVRH